MSKLISIAIPAYNNPDLLDRALQSIVNQTYRPIEIIISDDNSPKNLQKIVNKYINLNLKYLEFKYFKNLENLSFYGNNCAAFLKCTGELGMFLHHDDYFTDNNCLTHCIEILDRNKNVHMVITNSIVEHNLNTMMTWNYDGWQFINGQKYVNEYLYSIAHPSFSSVIFDRNVLELLGYSETFILHTDYKTKKIHFDEAFIFIILLSLYGDVAINGKVYTCRGSPPDSYSRSNDWSSMGGSIGGLIPLLNCYFKQTKENNRKIILNVILKVYTNLKFRDLIFLPPLLKKHGNYKILIPIFMISIIIHYKAKLFKVFSLRVLKDSVKNLLYK